MMVDADIVAADHDGVLALGADEAAKSGALPGSETHRARSTTSSEQPGVPRIAGLTRVRNEAHLIAETLDHHAAFCDAGIYVYDDCSTDDTADICRRHPAVIDVVQGEHWNPVRVEAEHENRQALLERALLDDPEWLLYFDADERVEVDLQEVPWSTCDAVRMKLFDFYITEEDVDSALQRAAMARARIPADHHALSQHARHGL